MQGRRQSDGNVTGGSQPPQKPVGTTENTGMKTAGLSKSDIEGLTKKIEDLRNELLSKLNNGTGATQDQVRSIVDGVSRKLDTIKNELVLKVNSANSTTASKDQINQISSKLNSISDIVTALRNNSASSVSGITSSQIDQIVSKVNDKLNSIKRDITANITTTGNEIKSKVGSGSSSSSSSYARLYGMHKTYFTYTAIFALALVICAIFITRGYLVLGDDYNALLLSTIIIFLATFFTVAIFNLVFSLGDYDVSDEDDARLAYYIVCGILVLATAALSLTVLLL